MTTINHFEDDYRLRHVDILKIDAEGSDSKVAVIMCMCDACLHNLILITLEHLLLH